MPNRMIRESCRTSATLNGLSAEAERLFWRLTTVADDFGRFEADPRVLLATCFPLKVGVLKIEAVRRWFEELTACSLVQTYANGCKQLAFFPTWSKYQYTRARTSKYPAPTSVSICSHVPTDSLVVTGSTGTTEKHESTEKHGDGAPGAPADTARPAPALIQFRINASITEALDRAPRLGAEARIRTPLYWQALVRAHGGVDYAHEILKAEAWMVANPGKAPRKNLARFLASWIGRAERPDEEEDD